MKFITTITLPDYLSLANGVCGLWACYLVLKGNVSLSLVLVLVAMVFDFLDGKVAHLTNTGSPYGKDIDSLCDTVSFGVAPAMQMFFYAANFPLALVVGIVWLVAGILRLARFNVLNVKTHFLGTPITLSAGIVVIAHLLSIPLYLLATVYVIFSILMVSDLKIKKI